nr:hypothetical protein BaRGS_009913 [Batillaria attramentaria]
MICASDVTFPEFVRYIIMSEMGNIPMMKRNPHFYPLSRQCGLCNEPENDSLTYDFIGKTESFAADARGILRASGLPGRLPPDFDLDVAVPKWSMQMLINFTFTKHYFHPMSDTCMTREETLRRVWRFYHIRGLISTSELFPLSSSGAELVTCEEFLNMSLAAFERSRGDPKLGANKKAAMKEAYSAVPLKQRQALRKIFRRDFMLFQYPASIPEVFPKGDRFVLEKFKYFDVFDRKNKNSF